MQSLALVKYFCNLSYFVFAAYILNTRAIVSLNGVLSPAQ